MDYTRKCVESIVEHTKEFELLFVDNASTNNTKEYLSSLRRSKVITNNSNLGFANQSSSLSKGALKAGLVGPRNYKGKDRQQIQVKLADLQVIKDFFREFNRKDPSKWFEVEWISGFCMLIKREVLESVGLSDLPFTI